MIYTAKEVELKKSYNGVKRPSSSFELKEGGKIFIDGEELDGKIRGFNCDTRDGDSITVEVITHCEPEAYDETGADIQTYKRHFYFNRRTLCKKCGDSGKYKEDLFRGGDENPWLNYCDCLSGQKLRDDNQDSDDS